MRLLERLVRPPERIVFVAQRFVYLLKGGKLVGRLSRGILSCSPFVLQNIDLLTEAIGFVRALLSELLLAGVQLPLDRGQFGFLFVQGDALAPNFVSLRGEFGLEFRPFMLKLFRGLVEALPLAGLIDLDVVTQPSQLSLLRGPLGLQLLGDAAALGLRLLAKHLELILLVGEPFFQFGGPSLAVRKLLNLLSLLAVGRIENELGLANSCRGGIDFRLPAVQFLEFSFDALLPAFQLRIATIQ